MTATIHVLPGPRASGWTLKEEFEGQAEWRRIKADEYPDDTRNLEAAELFDKLAGTADAIPQAMLHAYAALDAWKDCPDLWGEHLRAVGFHDFPENATTFLADYIEAVKSTRERFAAIDVVA